MKLKPLFTSTALALASMLPVSLKAQQLYASADNTVPTEVTTSRSDAYNAATKPAANDPKKDDAPLVITGRTFDALKASARPDSSYVGVYMIVNKDYPRTPEWLIEKTKTYFDHYGIPAIFVKQENPAEGKGFAMRIYVAGKSYDGNMTNGNVTGPEMRDNHQQIFATLRKMYDKANPTASPGPALSQN